MPGKRGAAQFNILADAFQHLHEAAHFRGRKLLEIIVEQAEYEGRIATLQAEHDARVKELEARLKEEGEVTATAREAQARGGIPVPRSPAGNGAPLGPTSWQAPTVTSIRSNLAAGYRQRSVRTE